MAKISVIVPAYNCEGTVKRCIESIINQTESDWELIIIDDGSTDKTNKICMDYVDLKKVFLYTQPNAGVSAARNLGIDKATGDYIVFVDSDDYLLCDALSTLRCSMENADICYFNYQIKKSKKIEHINYITKVQKVKIKDFSNIFKDLFKFGYINPPWAKCYRKELIKNKFEVGLSIGEDLLFNLNYLKECSNVLLIPYEFYGYQMTNSNSLSNSRNDQSGQLLEVFLKSTDICHALFGERSIYDCITGKYIIDQLNEIEKKVRLQKNYKCVDMKNNIEYLKIDLLCREKKINIQNGKWQRAVNMISTRSYLKLFIYLKIFKVLGGIKSVVRKD